jgi:hypothetical protein
MDKTVKELYKEEELAAYRAKKRLWNFASFAVLALALALCVSFCLRANVLNSSRMLIYCFITSAVGGWIFLTMHIFPLAKTRAAIKHIEAMLAGEREYHAGALRVTDERVFVKNGVPLVRVDSDGGVLRVWSEKAEELKKAELKGVYCVYGIIAAYEEKHEDF